MIKINTLVYNNVPSDYHKCHIGTIIDVNEKEFTIKYKEDSKEVKYPLFYYELYFELV